MNRGSVTDLDVMVLRSIAASMRPRFMNRGSDRPSVMDGRGELGFNEAPIHESGKSTPERVTGGRPSQLQ